MPTTPPERIELDGIVIRRETSDDAHAVADAIASNIPRLAPWMEWAVAEAGNVDTQLTRIADNAVQWNSGSVYDYLITDASEVEVLGKAGMHKRSDDGLEIGYWLTQAAEGRGFMTRIAAELTFVALSMDGIDKVEIHCDEANLRSRAIPERLGYRLDRVVDHPITTTHQTGRQMIWIYDATS
nr:GNAT family N-acetyltransferase [Rhodococcus sp. (in: high G+C Gram-positive bacteria)]